MSEREANVPNKRKRSRTSKLREAMLAAVSPRDVYDIMKLQLFLALKGDPIAAREVLDRTVGKPMDVASVVDMEQRDVPASDRGGVLESQMRQMLDSIPYIALPPPQDLSEESAASDAESDADEEFGATG